MYTSVTYRYLYFSTGGGMKFRWKKQCGSAMASDSEESAIPIYAIKKFSVAYSRYNEDIFSEDKEAPNFTREYYVKILYLHIFYV